MPQYLDLNFAVQHPQKHDVTTSEKEYCDIKWVERSCRDIEKCISNINFPILPKRLLKGCFNSPHEYNDCSNNMNVMIEGSQPFYDYFQYEVEYILKSSIGLPKYLKHVHKFSRKVFVMQMLICMFLKKNVRVFLWKRELISYVNESQKMFMKICFTQKYNF